MARKTPKTKVVAFKVEEQLADFLNKLPNKSAFIRKAIAAQLGMACPLCNGAGVVPRGVHDHYAPLLQQFNLSHCDGCGNELPLPRDPGVLAAEDRGRLTQQRLHLGPRGGEADGLFRQGGVVVQQPVEGLAAEGAQLGRVRVRQRRGQLAAESVEVRQSWCTWRRCSAMFSGAMCQPQSWQVGAFS